MAHFASDTVVYCNDSLPIDTKDEYYAALNMLNVLWGSQVGTNDHRELEELLTLVNEYEQSYH